MNITIRKLTDVDLFREACECTTGRPSSASLNQHYRAEHSPIRTQLFWIKMEDIPTYVSVHFVRHKVGVEHFVRSNRPDRGGDAEANRNSPVTHGMLCNAQALINMARKRLCYKASSETMEVMTEIRRQMLSVDSDLFNNMVPDCVYRGRCCELRPCGRFS